MELRWRKGTCGTLDSKLADREPRNIDIVTHDSIVSLSMWRFQVELILGQMFAYMSCRATSVKANEAMEMIQHYAVLKLSDQTILVR
jgi:hypothetical protein